MQRSRGQMRFVILGRARRCVRSGTARPSPRTERRRLAEFEKAGQCGNGSPGIKPRSYRLSSRYAGLGISGSVQCLAPALLFVIFLDGDADDHPAHGGCSRQFDQFVNFVLLGDHFFSVRHAALLQVIEPFLARITAVFGCIDRHREVFYRLLQRIRLLRGRGGLSAARTGRTLFFYVLGAGGRRRVGVMHLAAVIGPAVELGLRREGDREETECNEYAHRALRLEMNFEPATKPADSKGGAPLFSSLPLRRRGGTCLNACFAIRAPSGWSAGSSAVRRSRLPPLANSGTATRPGCATIHLLRRRRRQDGDPNRGALERERRMSSNDARQVLGIIGGSGVYDIDGLAG